jgi:hypothetical protein
MIDRIRHRQLVTLARWQKWALNEPLQEHGVAIIEHLRDGGVTLGALVPGGPEMRTVELPGTASVADVLRCAERGLRHETPEAEDRPPMVLIVLFWIVVVAGFAGLFWLAHIWSLAEATYYREGMR